MKLKTGLHCCSTPIRHIIVFLEKRTIEQKKIVSEISPFTQTKKQKIFIIIVKITRIKSHGVKKTNNTIHDSKNLWPSIE